MLMRAFAYVGFAALGYAGVFGVFVLWLMLFDKIPATGQIQNFKLVYFGGGLMACIAGTLIGLPCFFTQGKKLRFFLILPMLVPVLYSFGAMFYFH